MNKSNEETTHNDPTEPIVSWSGVQGETQEENVELPREAEEVIENKSEPAPSSEAAS